MVMTPEQLVSLLGEIWPASTSASITTKDLEEAFLNGLLDSVSGAPNLMPEKERKVQEQSEGNRYVGIHIALGMDESEKRPKIMEVIEGGPADRAGVKSGDLVEQIDGADTKGMPLREAVDRLRGDEGTKRDDQGPAGCRVDVADLHNRAGPAPASDDHRAGTSSRMATGTSG